MQTYIHLPTSISAKPGRLKLNNMWSTLLNYVWTSPANFFAIQSSAQNSKSTALLASILYSLFAKDVPSLIVSPTDELSNDLINRRLKPIIEASPELKKKYNRDKGFKSQDEVFSHNGTSIKTASAGSVTSLSSIAVSTAIVDEIDKPAFGYRGASDAGSLDLVKTRVTTFLNAGAKVIYSSTPTTEDGSNIHAMVQMSTRHEYRVPCPHCSSDFVPHDGLLDWNKKATLAQLESGSEKVHLKCPHCEKGICEKDFRQAAQKGAWYIPDGQEDRSPNFHSFVMNGVLAEMQTWTYIVTEYIRGSKNPSAMQRWCNEICGKVWAEAKIEYKPETFKECITEMPEGIIPSDAIAMYSATDVGWHDKGEEGKQMFFWATTLAVCKDGRIHVAATSKLDGEDELMKFLNTDFQTEDGRRFLASTKCLMDAGDGNVTLKVYDICNRNPGISPADGKSKILPIVWALIDSRRTWGNRIQLAQTVRQAHINGDTFKSQFWSMVKAKTISFASNHHKDTFIHYCGEKQILSRAANAGSKYKWVPTTEGAPNHLLDATVYALALVHDEKANIAVEEYRLFGSGEVQATEAPIQAQEPQPPQPIPQVPQISMPNNHGMNPYGILRPF
jgi:phage terminase large subunit GpA-like protein